MTNWQIIKDVAFGMILYEWLSAFQKAILEKLIEHFGTEEFKNAVKKYRK